MKLNLFLASILFAILLIVVVGTKKATAREYTGTYDTAYIRGLWGACFYGTKQSNPLLGGYFTGVFCDCVINKTRKQITRSELDLIPPEKRVELFTRYSEGCLEPPIKEEEQV